MPHSLLSRIRHSVFPRSKPHEHVSTAPQRDLHHLDTTTQHPCATAQPASTLPVSKSPPPSPKRDHCSTPPLEQFATPQNLLLSLPPELLAQIISYLLPAPTAPLKLDLPSGNDATELLPITHAIRDHPLAKTHPRLTECFLGAWIRTTGYDVSLTLSHSDDNEDDAQPWPQWTHPLRPYVRRLNVSIVWHQPETSPASASSPDPPPAETPNALLAGSCMLSIAASAIADLPQLSSLSTTFLVPAAHLELWPSLPASARVDLQSLFSFPRQDPSSHIPASSPFSRPRSPLAPRQLDILHTTVRGYHSLYGQLISHLVYSRRQLHGEKAAERGDWNGHKLYPGIWESVWSVEGLLQKTVRHHHNPTKSPDKAHPVL